MRTYRELAKRILAMSEEVQDSDVTIGIKDEQGIEFFPIFDFVNDDRRRKSSCYKTESEDCGNHYWTLRTDFIDAADGVLDDNHPFLAVKTCEIERAEDTE